MNHQKSWNCLWSGIKSWD